AMSITIANEFTARNKEGLVPLQILDQVASYYFTSVVTDLTGYTRNALESSLTLDQMRGLEKKHFNDDLLRTLVRGFAGMSALYVRGFSGPEIAEYLRYSEVDAWPTIAFLVGSRGFTPPLDEWRALTPSRTVVEATFRNAIDNALLEELIEAARKNSLSGEVPRAATYIGDQEGALTGNVTYPSERTALDAYRAGRTQERAGSTEEGSQKVRDAIASLHEIARAGLASKEIQDWHQRTLRAVELNEELNSALSKRSEAYARYEKAAIVYDNQIVALAEQVRALNDRAARTEQNAARWWNLFGAARTTREVERIDAEISKIEARIQAVRDIRAQDPIVEEIQKELDPLSDRVMSLANQLTTGGDYSLTNLERMLDRAADAQFESAIIPSTASELAKLAESMAIFDIQGGTVPADSREQTLDAWAVHTDFEGSLQDAEIFFAEKIPGTDVTRNDLYAQILQQVPQAFISEGFMQIARTIENTAQILTKENSSTDVSRRSEVSNEPCARISMNIDAQLGAVAVANLTSPCNAALAEALDDSIRRIRTVAELELGSLAAKTEILNILNDTEIFSTEPDSVLMGVLLQSEILNDAPINDVVQSEVINLLLRNTYFPSGIATDGVSQQDLQKAADVVVATLDKFSTSEKRPTFSVDSRYSVTSLNGDEVRSAIAEAQRMAAELLPRVTNILPASTPPALISTLGALKIRESDLPRGLENISSADIVGAKWISTVAKSDLGLRSPLQTQNAVFAFADRLPTNSLLREKMQVLQSFSEGANTLISGLGLQATGREQNVVDLRTVINSFIYRASAPDSMNETVAAFRTRFVESLSERLERNLEVSRQKFESRGRTRPADFERVNSLISGLQGLVKKVGASGSLSSDPCKKVADIAISSQFAAGGVLAATQLPCVTAASVVAEAEKTTTSVSVSGADLSQLSRRGFIGLFASFVSVNTLPSLPVAAQTASQAISVVNNVREGIENGTLLILSESEKEGRDFRESFDSKAAINVEWAGDTKSLEEQGVKYVLEEDSSGKKVVNFAISPVVTSGWVFSDCASVCSIMEATAIGKDGRKRAFITHGFPFTMMSDAPEDVRAAVTKLMHESLRNLVKDAQDGSVYLNLWTGGARPAGEAAEYLKPIAGTRDIVSQFNPKLDMVVPVGETSPSLSGGIENGIGVFHYIPENPAGKAITVVLTSSAMRNAIRANAGLKPIPSAAGSSDSQQITPSKVKENVPSKRADVIDPCRSTAGISVSSQFAAAGQIPCANAAANEATDAVLLSRSVISRFAPSVLALFLAFGSPLPGSEFSQARAQTVEIVDPLLSQRLGDLRKVKTDIDAFIPDMVGVEMNVLVDVFGRLR
ncbi:MAG: hypothetical protein RIQ56_444, partial [Candidatus Parcubacteria bacterium]